MKDEEMAEEYKADYGIDLCCLCRECEVENIYPCQHKKDAMYGYKDVFLAGLKAGRQWHKVADGDLPKHNHEVLCLMWGGTKEIGYYENEVWHFENFVADYEDVDYWQEIVLPELKESK